MQEVRSLFEQALSSESAQRGSDDPPAEEDFGKRQASAVVAQMEVSTAVAKPGVSGVAVQKAKRVKRTIRSRTSSTVSKESIVMAVQSSLVSKRTLELEYSPSAPLGLMQLGNVGLRKKGSNNPPATNPKEARKKSKN